MAKKTILEWIPVSFVLVASVDSILMVGSSPSLHFGGGSAS